MGSNKESKGQPKATLVWRTGLSGAPPDSVRCTRKLEAQLFTFGNFQRRSAKIHRTVRWVTRQCPVHTGLSGVTAEQQLLRAQRSTATHLMRACARRGAEHAWVAHRTAYRACPVHHRTARRAHKTELQRSTDVASAPDNVRWRTGLSGAPCVCNLPMATSWWLRL
jgi:hypothetical protein